MYICMYIYRCDCNTPNMLLSNNEICPSRNYTECERLTLCNITWLGDGLCDMNCNNEACNFDFNDCNNCKTHESLCGQMWFGFNVVAQSITPDYLIDKHEACQNWKLIKYYGQSVFIYNNWGNINCETLFDILDQNGDQKLNAYESQAFFFPPNRAQQANCSLCAPPNTYYK